MVSGSQNHLAPAHGQIDPTPPQIRDGAGRRQRYSIGYTYLLQFIAHDMVDSVLTFNIHDPDIIPGARNARSEALRLETLYGAGPDECPHAYDYTTGSSRYEG